LRVKALGGCAISHPKIDVIENASAHLLILHAPESLV
jgi:hypothetical protein